MLDKSFAWKHNLKVCLNLNGHCSTAQNYPLFWNCSQRFARIQIENIFAKTKNNKVLLTFVRYHSRFGERKNLCSNTKQRRVQNFVRIFSHQTTKKLKKKIKNHQCRASLVLCFLWRATTFALHYLTPAAAVHSLFNQVRDSPSPPPIGHALWQIYYYNNSSSNNNEEYGTRMMMCFIGVIIASAAKECPIGRRWVNVVGDSCAKARKENRLIDCSCVKWKGSS